MRVLILTTCKPDDRKALACVRALGQAGYNVHLGSDRHLGEASYSRFVQKRLLLPHPRDSEERYLASVAELVERYRYQVVLPTSDYTVLPLCEGRSSLASVLLPVASRSSALLALSKWESLKLASELGLETPRTQLIKEPSRLASAVKEFGYPCLVKMNSGAGALGINFLKDEKSRVKTAYGDSDMVFDCDNLLLQEWLDGEEVHEACLLFSNDEVQACFTQRRLRCFPHQGGAGIYNESTWRPDLVDRAVTLLKSLKWNGPAQVEFLINRPSGRIRFLEINGRFWATLGLAVQAGVNFPVLACHPGRKSEGSYHVGLRYRWPIPLGALHAWQSGDLLGSIADFFLPRRHCKSDLWWTDPIPKLAEALYALRRIYERGGRLNAPRDTAGADLC